MFFSFYTILFFFKEQFPKILGRQLPTLPTRVRCPWLDIPWYLISFNIEYSYCTGTSTVYIQYICLSTYMNIEMENCPDFPHNYILGKDWEHSHMFVYYRYHQSNILVLWNSMKRNCKDLGYLLPNKFKYITLLLCVAR